MIKVLKLRMKLLYTLKIKISMISNLNQKIISIIGLILQKIKIKFIFKEARLSNAKLITKNIKIKIKENLGQQVNSQSPKFKTKKMKIKRQMMLKLLHVSVKIFKMKIISSLIVFLKLKMRINLDNLQFLKIKIPLLR